MRYGDNPIRKSADDRLDRGAAVQALHELLGDRDLETPIAIGIFGEWGSGKTSVMHMLRSGLAPDDVSVWFDAWQYSREEEALWRALLLAVVESLRQQIDTLVGQPLDTVEAEKPVEQRKSDLSEELDRLVTSLYRSQQYDELGQRRVNWHAAIPLAVQTALAFVPAGSDIFKRLKSWFAKDDPDVAEITRLIEREHTTTYRDQVRSLEQFQQALRELIARYFGTGDAAGTGRRLYVFVDDLDRCLPEEAVSALEAIKVYLSIPACVFVLGMDRRVVQEGIRIRYQKATDGAGGPYVDPSQYLDKIIQIPFTLPPLSDAQIRRLIAAWGVDHEEAIGPDLSLLLERGVAANPRRVKRTLNVLRLVHKLRALQAPPSDGGPPGEAEMAYLAKIVVLQTSYEPVYERAIEWPTSLKLLEASALNPTEGSDEAKLLSVNLRLGEMLRTGSRFTELSDDELGRLLSITRVSDTSALSTP